MGERIVRIGGASGFWGDSAIGPVQLAGVPGIDYIVFDYLAELTMSLLAAARMKNPELGYATDFVGAVRRILPQCKRGGIRLVSNAGGLNPAACAAAIEAVAQELGLKVRVAIVEGDDVGALVPELREAGVTDFYSGAPIPARLASANAYLGALPIKAALDAGADIVVTGRVVDSAVTLGALMHEFGWSPDDLDLLAQGSLAGHLIECGCQATGGLHTDWRAVPDWAGMGYPVLECAEDGSFVVTKPAGTGGLVSVPAVAEQMLYEIGDPARYVLPDLVCDFTAVTIESAGEDRVRVSGARGLPATDSYKVAATYADGFRTTATLSIVGFEARAKAERTAEAILARSRAMFAAAGLADFTATRTDIFGDPDPAAVTTAVLRLAVAHPDKKALELFAREIAPAGTSWATGTVGSIVPGRPAVSPSVKLATFLIDKARVTPRVSIGGQAVPVPPTRVGAALPAAAPAADAATIAAPDMGDDPVQVPLIRLAYARSGDKGRDCNIGVIARRPDLYACLAEALTAPAVAAFLGLAEADVTRFAVPGIDAFNFVLRDALGGGGMASLLQDPLGKSMAQALLAIPVTISGRLARTLNIL